MGLRRGAPPSHSRNFKENGALQTCCGAPLLASYQQLEARYQVHPYGMYAVWQPP